MRVPSFLIVTFRLNFLMLTLCILFFYKGITRNVVRPGEEGFETNVTDVHQDFVRPLLHVVGSPSTASGRQEQPTPEQV